MNNTRDILLSKALRTSIRSMNEIREMSLKITRISELLQMEFDQDVHEALTATEAIVSKNELKYERADVKVLLQTLSQILDICNEKPTSAKARGAHSKLAEIAVTVSETLKHFRDEEEQSDSANNVSAESHAS